MTALYDTIGHGYANRRQPDPRINQAIQNALGNAGSVVNVGAGCGSYEPVNTAVVAVELSTTMIEQRPASAAPAVQATAMALPFRDKSFDASLAVLTVHHWPDKMRGLAELRRVTRQRVVILTWDPAYANFWLSDYLPRLLEIDRPQFPAMDQFGQAFGQIRILPVPIPHDCTDGFMCAYWRRPAAYLDPGVRRGISTFAKLGDVGQALKRLERDLKDGTWHKRYGDILQQESLDLGYRLIVATP